MNKIGELTVYWGSMFSGKTTRLVEDLQNAGIGSICFKPANDVRDATDIIKTHDGMEFPATPIESASMIFMFLDDSISTIGIEEASLLLDDPTLIPTINLLRDMGYNVVVTGLDLTAEDQPFGQMPVIAAMADECIKMRSTCSDCGEKASNSFFTGDQKDVVEVGGEDKYKPLCRSCYTSQMTIKTMKSNK
ncbi:thymidine kinase [Solibacillus silvestris]